MFEAWKVRDEVAPLLAKDFELLYVDVSRNPGGGALMISYPASRGQGIPWFVVLDALDGNQVMADSNGPKGNIGCPNTDEEIDVFEKIVKKVARSITADEIATLRKSLVAHRNKK